MVYVDDMYTIPLGNFGRMKMSHMIADTTEELLAMADKIGLNKKWIQYPGNWKEHFDVSISLRKLAVVHGAKEITMREGNEILKRRVGHPYYIKQNPSGENMGDLNHA